MSDRGHSSALPPVTAGDYFAAVREVEAAERHMQDVELSHQPNSPTLLSADGALERAREKVAALEDRAARQSGLQAHEAAAGIHFGADGIAYRIKDRIAVEIEAAYAERQAQLAKSPRHQAYQRDSQRLNERDLAFNGLLDKQTFADPRHAPTAEGVRSAQDKVSVLLDQARGRDFTDSEAIEWQTALGDQASHYVAEEGRAR